MYPRPLISVIIPVFNLEDYLAESIGSVLSQSVGLKNIQLILVDDGSSDKSAAICQEYANQHKGNVIFIKQDNQGVSRARNVGFQKATGRYIHFLDGDDILPKGFYKKTTRFLKLHENEVDFVATKLKFFDEIIDAHPLNYKFRKTRVIDLEKESNNPILHVISCVFLKSSIENIKFDERLSIAEDIKFLYDVLLQNKKYGVLKSPAYNYRKRSSGGSAIGGKERNRDYYQAVPKHVYQHMLETWHGDTEPVEHALLYELAYRLEQKIQPILSQKEEEIYKESIKSLAAKCSDKVTVQNKYLSIHQKLYILKVKYGYSYKNKFETQNGVTKFAGYNLYDHATTHVHLDFMTHRAGDNYKLEGYVDTPDLPEVTYCANVVGQKTKLKFVPRAQRQKSFLDDIYFAGGAFEAELDLPKSSRLSFSIETPGKILNPITQAGPFTKFGVLPWTYRRDQNRLFKRQSGGLISYPYSFGRHLVLELRMLAQVSLNWRFGTTKTQFGKLRARNLKFLSSKAKLFELAKPFLFMAEAIFYIPRAWFLRVSYYVAKPFKKRPIWLVSDRPMAAGDNGEALFKYIINQKNCPADVYFVISKKSKDHNRLQKTGKVLDQTSLKYKLKFLLADKIISSQADTETTNPFFRQLPHYVDLLDFDFVFLQHGVIRYDLSDWLNRFGKNIALFITSGRKEYDSILGNPYYYAKENVLLSGLPRFDYLENKPNKKLILAPTYRKNLAKMPTDKSGQRGYDPSFKHSEYRQFYNNFMNDGRLLQALKNASMIGEFYLHPNFSAQRQDFDENEQFKVMPFPHDYNRAFEEGELMISDHSSVIFDFAYLKKPVLYAHFDKDTFFAGHSYDESGFYSDETDGFGEVYYDYDSLVEGVTQAIKSGCVLPDKYAARIDKFFYKVDKHNSERVYSAILGMTK